MAPLGEEYAKFMYAHCSSCGYDGVTSLLDCVLRETKAYPPARHLLRSTGTGRVRAPAPFLLQLLKPMDNLVQYLRSAAARMCREGLSVVEGIGIESTYSISSSSKISYVKNRFRCDRTDENVPCAASLSEAERTEN